MYKPSLKTHTLAALLLGILVAVAYAPIANLSFLSDDWAVIRLVTLPDGVTNWARNLNDFYTPLFDRSPKYRPLYSMSFALDFALYGTVPFGYHLTNLALHAISSFFVYLLTLELVQGERRWEVSLTSGALFALYPVHPEAVTWIAGRVDLICAVFYLPVLLFFLRWLRTGGRLDLALSLTAFVLSLLAKEMAVALPGLLFLLAMYRKRSFKGAVIRVLPFAITLGAYLIFRSYVLSGTESFGVAGRGLDPVASLQGFVYRTSHMFFPINLGLLPGALRNPVELAFFLLPILAVIALVVAYYRGWAKEKLPVLLFALYVVSLVPVIKGFRPDPVLVSSRWAYIPSAFLAILIAYLLWTVFAERARWAAAVSAVVCALFFALLLMNNGPWLQAGEMTARYLEAGETPDYPAEYRGAPVFINKITWISANRPPFEGRS